MSTQEKQLFDDLVALLELVLSQWDSDRRLSRHVYLKIARTLAQIQGAGEP